MNISKINSYVASNKLGKGEIAERCGISRTTLDNVLSGADVKISTVEKLASVLGVNVGSFFDEEPVSNKAIASGKNSVAAINSEVKPKEDAGLEEKIRLLEQLLKEKERTIQILMQK